MASTSSTLPLATATTSIDECVVVSERVQERRGLDEEVGVGVLPEHGRPRAVDGRVEQADVANQHRYSDGVAGGQGRLLDRQPADHSPSRRSSSAKRSAPRSARRSVSSSSSYEIVVDGGDASAQRRSLLIGEPEVGHATTVPKWYHRRVVNVHGVVVDNVNVSVLLYGPVRSGSVTAIGWRKFSVTVSLLTGPV